MTIRSGPLSLIWAAATVIAVTASGCRGKHQHAMLDEGNQEQAASVAVLRPVIRVADPSARQQLSKGFFDVTANSWRWTARQFSVVLATPLGGAGTGGVITLSFNLPEMEVKAVGPVTLSVSVRSTPLGSETYTAAGDYTFKKDVPANLLSGSPVTVDFVLDKAMPPKPPETRELGLIVTSVGLQPR